MRKPDFIVRDNPDGQSIWVVGVENGVQYPVCEAVNEDWAKRIAKAMATVSGWREINENLTRRRAA